MKTNVETTLSVDENTIDPRVLAAWLKSLPEGAKIEFVITKGYDDRFSYSPDRVSGIKATWTQDFGV